MSSLGAARQLAAEAAAELAADLEVGKVSTLTDPRKIPNLVANGDFVVCVNPPSRSFLTWHEEEWEWEVWLVAGPSNDLETAWERLDRAVDLLATPLEVETARADAFTDQQRAQYPAYVLTITTTYRKE